MINIEYFASKVRRERDALDEEVSEERVVPPSRRQSTFPGAEPASGARDPELEPVS
jgi:hypothetical protein